MKSNNLLVHFSLLVLGIFFLVKGLVLAEVFLVPIIFAVMLTLVCIPMVRKLEKIGLSRGLAAFASVFACLLVYLAFFAVIAIQVGNMSERWPEMKKQLTPKISEALVAVEDKTGLKLQNQLPAWLTNSDSTAQVEHPKQQQAQTVTEDETPTEDSQSKGEQAPSEEKKDFSISDGVKKQLGQLAVNVFGFLGSSMLLFVYLFFLLFFRHKVKLSLLRFFSSGKRREVREVLEKSSELAVNFVGGRLLLVMVLAVLYTVGLLIAGVENAILISVMAAMLNLVPYVGSIVGYFLAMAMGLFGGAEMGALIVISVTFAVAQFVDNNILEPFVVGDKVNLNPLATIILVVLGGSIWGVAGMILSIPIAGILKIVFDTTPDLEPLGYILGAEDSSEGKPGFFSRWVEKFRGKQKRSK